jgi:class 3 adenylate cyclase
MTAARPEGSAAAASSGVVTFLFTDIEGSTRRWEADADAMRAALMAHDEVLRSAIEAHDGYLFSHTGDGVVAAFTSPKSAVDAAISAQRALELPVGMGIATGEAELRDGDCFKFIDRSGRNSSRRPWSLSHSRPDTRVSNVGIQDPVSTST